jgi:diguanylate cyclase (GGDEF)-like protein
VVNSQGSTKFFAWATLVAWFALLAALSQGGFAATLPFTGQPAPQLDRRNVHFESADKNRAFIEYGGVGSIAVITQDRDGFIWVGGENGLMRYDGHRFRIYRNDPKNSSSLCGNYVRDIEFDRTGTMWLGTTSGLCQYNAVTDQFYTYPTDPGSNNSLMSADVSSLVFDGQNRLYVGTSKGLSVLNEARTQFVAHYTPGDGPSGITYDHVEALWLDGDDLWIGTIEGLNRLNLTDNVVTPYRHDPNDPKSLPEDDIRSITGDEQGNVWLASLGGGLIRLHQETGEFHSYKHRKNSPNSIAEDTVWQIYQDHQARIWAATDNGGLALYRPETDDFINFQNEITNPHSLASNKVRALFQDNRGDLWVGTFKGTLQLFSQESANIFKYTHSETDANSIPNEALLTFKETQNGIIWIGTENGAAAFRPETNTFTRIPFDKDAYPNGLQAGAILAIEEAPNNDLWLGTWSGGLHRYIPETGIFTSISTVNQAASVNSPFIWDLLLDQQQRLWIGTQTGGLNMLDTASGAMSYFLNDPNDETSISRDFVYSLLEDTEHNELWVGTKLGLNVLDLAQMDNPTSASQPHFKRYLHDPAKTDSLSDHRINCMLFVSTGELWIGTENGGINVYDRENDRFEKIFRNDELPSNNIASMIEDAEGFVWVTTPSGAAKVQASSRTRQKTYYKHHGLAGDRFNRNATLLSRRGDIYLGSTTGFSVIQKRPLLEKSTPLRPYINLMQVNYEEVQPATSALISQQIHKTQQITLNHLQNALNFEFSAMTFRAPMYNKYRFRLTGFEEQWHHSNAHDANYTNLDAGHYVFEVFAEDSDGRISEQPARLEITILPSPWRTWWAYGIYFIFAFGLFYWLYHYLSTIRQSRQYKLLSHSDFLTGIYNRAGTEAKVREALIDSKIDGEFALILIDVDRFKSINDVLGHDIGDEVLHAIAQIISGTLRNTDIFGRWGGDELALLVSQTRPETARIIAEKIQAAVRNHTFGLHQDIRVTLSIGIAYSLRGETLGPLFKRADLAMYEAKGAGRDCAVELDKLGHFNKV